MPHGPPKTPVPAPPPTLGVGWFVICCEFCARAANDVERPLRFVCCLLRWPKRSDTHAHVQKHTGQTMSRSEQLSTQQRPRVQSKSLFALLEIAQPGSNESRRGVRWYENNSIHSFTLWPTVVAPHRTTMRYYLHDVHSRGRECDTSTHPSGQKNRLILPRILRCFFLAFWLTVCYSGGTLLRINCNNIFADLLFAADSLIQLCWPCSSNSVNMKAFYIVQYDVFSVFVRTVLMKKGSKIKLSIYPSFPPSLKESNSICIFSFQRYIAFVLHNTRAPHYSYILTFTVQKPSTSLTTATATKFEFSFVCKFCTVPLQWDVLPIKCVLQTL